MAKNSYTIAKSSESDQKLQQCYDYAKSLDSHFTYDELDIIFEVALQNRELFPGINLAGNNTASAYLIRWVSEYRSAITMPPSARSANPKSACSDPAIKQIVMVTQHISQVDASAQEKHHNLFMSAENIQGNLLEEYIAINSRPYGWIWCAGNTLRAIDFCNRDGSVLLQIKNKSNTENSSSSNIREGTSILKWYRLGTKTIQKKMYPAYKWDSLNKMINDHKTAGFHLPPCNMSEEHYVQFITRIAEQNPLIITSE